MRIQPTIKKMTQRILYIQYAAPGVYPPIERSARIFKLRGWEVGFLAVRPEGQMAALTSSMHSEDEIEYLVHQKGGLKALRSYLRFWWRAWQRVQREKPDVVYLSDMFSYPAGLAISLTSPALTILHEHDTPLDRSSPFLKVLHAVRTRFARRASIRINPQKERAELIQRETGCGPFMIVHNCPSLGELPETLAFDDKPGGLTLWHHGSLGPGRLPFSLLAALPSLPEDVTLAIAGYETINTVGFVDETMERARALGVGHRVTYHGAMKRDALYREAAKAHVGLSMFVREFVEPMVGASNKPFDFLACNMALLVNDTDEWKDFYERRGVALACDPEDSAAVAQAITRLHEDRDTLRRMADRGRELIESEWNYEAEFEPVLQRIDTLLAPRQ